jgi:hypothetical protein
VGVEEAAELCRKLHSEAQDSARESRRRLSGAASSTSQQRQWALH